MLDCQSSSLNAVFGREVRIQMLKMAVFNRQDGVEKKKPPSTRRTAVDGGKGHRVGWRLPSENLTTEGVVKEIEKRSQNSTVVFGKSVIKDEFHELPTILVRP